MNGILMTPDNIKATAEKRKTQTRRLLNPQPFMERGVLRWQPKRNYPKNYRNGMHLPDINMTDNSDLAKLFSPYKIRQVVYIKESHYLYGCWLSKGSKIKTGRQQWMFERLNKAVFYPDNKPPEFDIVKGYDQEGWYLRSPLFLAEDDARYFIKINDILLQRLRGITEAEAKAEGVQPLYKTALNTMGAGYIWTSHGYQDGFINLWNSINPKYPFENNYWVWAYSYELLDGRP